MINDALWSAIDAETATGGHSTGPWQAMGVSIDSRSIAAGDLFVALKGPRHDGHDFVAAAVAGGAAAAMVTRMPRGLPSGAPLLVVKDTQLALEALGRAARDRTRARIVAVTGSVGKTSTKDALWLALASQGATHASAASHNNAIGVPLSLARLPQTADFGVFEIGMNHAGEIMPLTLLARPHVAVITTIEAVHIENFPQGLDGIAAAKAEILMGASGGVAILNRDNSYFELLARRAHECGVDRVIGFGAHPAAEARVIDFKSNATSCSVMAQILGRAVSYRIGAPGRHWVVNSLAVLAAAHALGADIGAAAAALANMSAPKGRGRRHRVARGGGSFELIDDSYNASPASVRASLEVLAAAQPGPSGRRIAVLGDMLELGPDAPRLHAGLADALEAAGVDLVFTCGDNMARLYDALPTRLRAGQAATSDQLIPLVRLAIGPGDVVVVKGSLGSRMGRIVDALLSGGANASTADETPRRRLSQPDSVSG